MANKGLVPVKISYRSHGEVTFIFKPQTAAQEQAVRRLGVFFLGGRPDNSSTNLTSFTLNREGNKVWIEVY